MSEISFDEEISPASGLMEESKQPFFSRLLLKTGLVREEQVPYALLAVAVFALLITAYLLIPVSRGKVAPALPPGETAFPPTPH